MGLLYERTCGHCENLFSAVSTGVCEVTDHRVIKYGDEQYAEKCPYYKNRYGFHESGIKEKDMEEFHKCCSRLSNLIKKIRKYSPEAQYYLANESLHLLVGSSHDELTGTPQSNNSVADELISFISCGDW